MQKGLKHGIGTMRASLFLSCPVVASTEVDQLPATQCASAPYDFSYELGAVRVMTYYPAKLSAKDNSAFNVRLLENGICPLNLVSVINKDRFAPVGMVISEMQKQVETSVDPSCTVSMDTDHTVKHQLSISDEPTVLVLDEQGRVTARYEGLLTARQEARIIRLLAKNDSHHNALTDDP